MFSTEMKQKSVFLFSLLSIVTITNGQSCQGGSFYDTENPTPYSIEEGNWYLNVERPCQCSGELQMITVQYSMLQSMNYRVNVAVWTPVEDGGDSYSVVTSTIEELRRNANGPNALLSAGYETSSVYNLYVRKGAIIGVFFEFNRTPLPVIGTVSSSTNYTVCKLPGTLTGTTMIDCTSTNMISNLIIDAKMDIDIIACEETAIPTVDNGYYTLIDGDVEYGARVQYSCDSQYVINVEDNVLQCNELKSWTMIGTVTPTCTFVGTSGSVEQTTSVSVESSSVSVESTSEPSTSPDNETQSNSSAVGIAVGVVIVLILISIAMITVIAVLIVLKTKYRKLFVFNSADQQIFRDDDRPTKRKKGSFGNFSNPIYEETDINTQPIVYESVTEMDLSSVKDSHGYFQLEPFSASISLSSAPLQSNSIYETPTESKQGDLYNSLFESSMVKQELSADKENDGIYGVLFDEKYAQLEELRNERFTKDAIYWQPESDAVKIYEQLAMKKYREIPREKIKITEFLGSGQFGTVDKGEWTTARGTVEVAIKTLKGLATDEEETKFLQEAAINGQFHHPNVVQLCGVVTIGQPIHIVMEYVPNGDLKTFLERERPTPGELADDLLPEMLIKFSHQIASGMVYLSEKKFIHRDLAARNILVSYGDVCKIADFGMSRDLQDEAYYRSENKRIPVKWTAPEAINYRKYSTQSDVWSFGALLFEIWSVGYKPFQIYTNAECMRLVDSGWRLPSPPGCPRSIYELMIMCWNPDTSCRPAFDFLQSNLSKTESLLLAAQQLKASLGTLVQWDQSLYPDLQDIYKI